MTLPPLWQDPRHYVTDLTVSPAGSNDTRLYSLSQSILHTTCQNIA
jgi:hypothetical protein